MTVLGFVEEINEAAILGWAIARSGSLDPVELDLFLDEQFVQSVICAAPRPDLQAIKAPHINAGFRAEIPAFYRDGRLHVASFKDPAGQDIMLAAIDGEPQPGWTFCIAGDGPPTANYVGFIENTSNGHVAGWLIDRKSNEPVCVRMYVDNIYYKDVKCVDTRSDVLAAGESRAEVGFSVKMPARFFDGRKHTFSFTTEDGQRMVRLHAPKTSGSKMVFESESPRHVCLGQVDGLQNGAIRGWCLVVDRYLDRKIDSCEIVIKLGSQIIGQVTANQPRPDVAAAFDSGMLCGFSYVPPSELAIGRTLQLSLTVAPHGLELPGSPVKVDFLDQHSYAILNNLLSEVDELFTRTWKIRTLIKNLIPNNMYNLHSYHHWAKKYYENLAARFDGKVLPMRHRSPLVSVICPAYRPRAKDFDAAVRSVINQTYENWELIIVDDASGSQELTDACLHFSKRDRRIVFLQLEANAGISGASNVALEEARGDFILLFDHDDLLVPQAIDVMLRYQEKTGAKMLYSDEDKIDDDGIYSEVHLKPDWNYRLMLSQNYVCHLLMIEHAHLRRTGFFRKDYDGAQDHDLILRLSEGLTRKKIVHVPEILYHWRKTPSSTAASGASKGYAVSAGARCIEDHLKRRGRSAEVVPLRGATIYQVNWRYEQAPSVSVIIPYREQIKITRECVTSLFERTAYPNFTVVLADNWSDSAEAESFKSEVATNSRVTYLRVAERFNYSRINNLAVAASRSDYLLFLNNDVITIRPDWLRLMVDELIADDDVAIVGIKLLYPNGLVQHGGVVMGVGGIADHAHKMLAEDDPGYMARAICAQETTAVTAACLLCRRSVFESVGGFDEKELHVAYNDVDLCLRVRAAGHQIIWLPNAVAEHHESLSRGNDLVPSQQVRFFHEHEIMTERWANEIGDDPYYNPSFSRRSDIFLGLGSPKKDLGAQNV